MSISNPQLNGIKETITRYYKIFSRYFLKTNLLLKIYVLHFKKTMSSTRNIQLKITKV